MILISWNERVRNKFKYNEYKFHRIKYKYNKKYKLAESSRALIPFVLVAD